LMHMASQEGIWFFSKKVKVNLVGHGGVLCAICYFPAFVGVCNKPQSC
jgi:hypothetical protein